MALMIRFLSYLERICRFLRFLPGGGLFDFALYTNILFFSFMSCFFILSPIDRNSENTLKGCTAQMKTMARGLNKIQLIYQKLFQSLLTPCREPALGD